MTRKKARGKERQHPEDNKERKIGLTILICFFFSLFRFYSSISWWRRRRGRNILFCRSTMKDIQQIICWQFYSCKKSISSFFSPSTSSNKSKIKRNFFFFLCMSLSKNDPPNLIDFSTLYGMSMWSTMIRYFPQRIDLINRMTSTSRTEQCPLSKYKIFSIKENLLFVNNWCIHLSIRPPAFDTSEYKTKRHFLFFSSFKSNLSSQTIILFTQKLNFIWF